MIRLTVNIAKIICPDLEVDFGDGGWEALKKAILVRNRITHPKCIGDMHVSDSDVETAQAGFFWLFDMAVHVMEQTLHEHRIDFEILKQIVDDLSAGDPETLALYQDFKDKLE